MCKLSTEPFIPAMLAGTIDINHFKLWPWLGSQDQCKVKPVGFIFCQPFNSQMWFGVEVAQGKYPDTNFEQKLLNPGKLMLFYWLCQNALLCQEALRLPHIWRFINWFGPNLVWWILLNSTFCFWSLWPWPYMQGHVNKRKLKLQCQLSHKFSIDFDEVFGMLYKFVGVINPICILSWSTSIPGRELYLWFLQNPFNIGLHFDICNPTSFKLNMMIETTELYIWMILNFIQRYGCMRNKKFLCSVSH